MADPTNPMSHKICMITGATAGIGLVTARELAHRGATVIVVGRSPERSATTVRQIRQQTGNANVDYMLADLSSMKEVRKLAQQFKDQYQTLHVLVNNAGAIFLGRQVTAEGVEMTWGLNHLSYFLLTNLLLDTIVASAPARILNVSSRAHERAAMHFDDLQGQRRYSGTLAYGQSKLANVMFTYELARRLEGTGITVNALHPGFVASNFAANNGPLARLARPILNLFSISVEDGARTSVYLATSPSVEGVTGKYFVEEKEVPSSEASYDQAGAKRLWQISAEMTGLVQA